MGKVLSEIALRFLLLYSKINDLKFLNSIFQLYYMYRKVNHLVYTCWIFTYWRHTCNQYLYHLSINLQIVTVYMNNHKLRTVFPFPFFFFLVRKTMLNVKKVIWIAKDHEKEGPLQFENVFNIFIYIFWFCPCFWRIAIKACKITSHRETTHTKN